MNKWLSDNNYVNITRIQSEVKTCPVLTKDQFSFDQELYNYVYFQTLTLNDLICWPYTKRWYTVIQFWANVA